MARKRAARQQNYYSTLVIVALLIIVVFGVVIPKTQIPLLVVGLMALALIAGITVLGFIQLAQVRKRQALRAVRLNHVDMMSGVEFEQYVGQLLRFQGYKVHFTAASGDYGVDIIAKQAGQQTAVQVKRYGKPVGLAAVQQAAAGAVHYNTQKSMVVSNQAFTKAAKNLAQSNRCELVDRVKLGEMIVDFSNSQKKRSIISKS